MADELKALEKHISDEYRQAMKELQQKSDEYFAKYQKRYEDVLKEYQEGKIDKQTFINWKYTQLARGEQWHDLKDQYAQRMTEVRQIAVGYINDTLPSAYAKTSNEILNLARKSAMAEGVTGIRWDLVDESTVRNLMLNKRNNISFRTVSINPIRDYEWNSSRIQNAVLQGILQGDSMKGFTDRFMDVMKNNRNSAIRNARTAVTSARNAGKQDRYSDLARQGCEFTKVWVATHDNRVRDAHINADGQEVPYNEPFIVGGEEMMFPADSNGSPWNVYNCRCTMKTGKIRFHSMLTDQQKKDAHWRVLSNG